ncbi:MAG: nucleotidyltransferase domain-containing protein [Cyanobacteria bacterium J06636_16]
MRNPEIDIILRKIKDHLNHLYKDRLQAIILYGSQAREDSHKDSDIDILVVLSGPTNPYKEIDRTSDFIAQICLEYNVLISRHFVSSEKFHTGSTPFLQNVGREGIAL